MIEEKVDFKNDLFGNYHRFKLLKQSLIMSFSMLGYPLHMRDSQL